jgi:hypothetical protein
MDIEEILKQIDETCTEPFVTARFGENWKQFMKEEYLTENCDIDSIINIAWKQGRKAILMEKVIRQYAQIVSVKERKIEMLTELLRENTPEYTASGVRATGATPILSKIKNLFKRKL